MNRIKAERYEWLFRSGTHLVTATDDTGRFFDVSDGFAKRMGRTREALLRLSPQELATPECATKLEAEWLPGLKNAGQMKHIPIEYKDARGESVNLIADTRLGVTYTDGKFISISCYTEVDDWNRVGRRFQALYRNTPAMLHTLDINGHITEVSDRWLEKLGYKRKQVIGRYIGEFYSHSVKQDLKDGSLTNLHYAEEYSNHPREMVTSKGDILEVLVSAAQVKNKRGEVIRLQVALKDVTDRNKAQRELHQAFAENAQLRKELEQERDYLRETVNVSMNYGEIIGDSPALRSMLGRIEAVAHTSANVLIVGESGTGKELVAHAIHSRSQRANNPLVSVNCASIPRELFESEFFGHVKGAFTGATRDRIGRFQLANSGTLFLDEIGEIPLELQGKLLRVLEQQEFERVGDDTTRKIDVRVVAATNRDLAREVANGNFREDLYYRLNVFPIDVPPLRERGDDVVQIASHLVTQICQEFGRQPIPMTETDIRNLRAYDWPGNVRELKNLLERAVILAKNNRLQLHVPSSDAEFDTTTATTNQDPGDNYLTELQIKQLIKRNTEKALRAAHWKVSGQGGAAELLGIKPTTLADRIRAYGLIMPGTSRGRPRQESNL